MRFLIGFGVIALLVFVGVCWIDRVRKARRAELAKQTFSDAEREAIAEDFQLYQKLPDGLRDRVDGLAHVFIDEKGFEACGGLEQVTEHMQRVIAVQACVLIVNRPHNMYKNLRTILVYPSAFGFNDDGVRLGESWSSGSVILSWDAVISGGRNDEDGHDVSLHEFSHQLDQENAHSEGVPYLPNGGAYREWAVVFSAGYERFIERVEAGKKTVIDEYGATNPAEFFAVTTETFFEKPKKLQQRYPEMYDALCKYYGLNPLEWR